MRIGLDARFLSHPQRGGFKTYTENLISALSEVDDANDYFVYLDRPFADQNVPRKANWHYKVVDGSIPIVGMVIREQWLLKKQIVQDQIDVIHFLCNTAPVDLKKPYIVTLHDTIQVTTRRPFRLLRSPAAHKSWVMEAYSKWAINKSIRSADRIITVSDYEQKLISDQFNIPSNRITAVHLAPNPVFKPARDAEKSIWRSDLSKKFRINRKFILGVGYARRKNIEFLIEAYSHLSVHHSDLDLVIVCAERTRRIYFERIAEKLRLSNRIHILDSMPPEELVTLYNLAEVFIYPSERESFGLPPLEAISCGVPTIAMKGSSIPEILQEGALLISGKDVQVWTNAIRRVLTDENYRLNLISCGLEQAAKFNWHNCAKETIQVYSDMKRLWKSCHRAYK